jgi:C4-dicarboxylate-specific signal transduction histidine kinase/ActR/RegA family two-component response regulator
MIRLRTPSRLSWRLLAAILPPVVLAVAAIVWLQYHLARREILGAIDKEASSLARRLSADVDDLLDQRRRDLLTLAETPLIADYYRNVEFGLRDEAETYRKELERYLKNFSARTGVYARICYLDENGRIVAGAGPALTPAEHSRARDAAFLKARAAGPGGLWTSSIEDRPGAGPVVYYLKPVFDERGTFKGALGLAYDLAGLREKLRGLVVGRRGRAFVLAENGRRVEGRPAIDGGLELLTARSALRERPWTVTVEAPLDDFLAPLVTVRNAALLTLLFGTAGLVVILLILVRSITRPIAVLVDAARRFGAGDLEHRIRDAGTDELGTLSGAFNEMGERLEKNRARNTELQSQLIQAEKLSAVGQLISAVAHELNNPLGAISGYVQLVMHEGCPAPLRRDLEQIYANVMRCRKVVDNLLFFVRKSRHERGKVDLNRAVGSALELLEYRLLKTEDVFVIKELADEPPLIVGDYQQIVQVLINLINNGCDAMAGVVRYPEGKRLLLRTGREGGRVFLRVEDNGPGMSAESEAKLFQPFYTTKAPGRGTGLGLSICRQIARGHGGDVLLENRPGRGCAFVLDLPAGSEEEFARLDRKAPPDLLPPVPGKRVLVADDEADMVEVVSRLLREEGDEVSVAHGGAEALKLLENGEFDLIISDMEMEQVKGQDIFKRTVAGGGTSTAKVLFVTGDILNPNVLDFLSKTRSEHLSKPFDIDDLRQAVRRLLASGER